MRWFTVILIILVALVVGMYALTVANVIDPGAFIVSKLEKWESTKAYVETYRLGLQEEETLAKRQAELETLALELDKRREALAEQEAALAKKAKDLENQEARISTNLAKLNQQEVNKEKAISEKKALQAEAVLLSEMETGNILAILENMPTNKQAKLLAYMDPDTIRNVLSSMEPEKAASILPQVSLAQIGGE